MGEVEKDGKVLIVKRIRVRYRIRGVLDDHREAAERAHAAHANSCPVARSIKDAIDITTEMEYV